MPVVHGRIPSNRNGGRCTQATNVRRPPVLIESDVMPKTELDGLPVIEVPDSEEITVAIKPEDIEEGNEWPSPTNIRLP